MNKISVISMINDFIIKAIKILKKNNYTIKYLHILINLNIQIFINIDR